MTLIPTYILESEVNTFILSLIFCIVMEKQNIIVLFIITFIGIKTFYLYFYSSELSEKFRKVLENPTKKRPKPKPLSGDLHLHLHKHQIIRKASTVPKEIPKIMK